MTHDPTTRSGLPDPSLSHHDDLEPADGADDLDGLMQRLRGIADEVDAPSALVSDLARAAFETRDLDAELAVLSADSDVDTLALTRAAGAPTAPRMMSFEAESVTLELELHVDGSTTTMTGLVHGNAGLVEIESNNGRTPVDVDNRGWFTAEVVAGQLVRLRVSTTRSPVITTEWVRI